MGVFHITIDVGSLAGTWFGPVSALVDTGASHTVVPTEVLEGLGIQPVERLPFELADGKMVEHDIGEGRVRINGRERNTLLVFGDSGSRVLLGASTLELLNLGVDPVSQRLIPVPGLLMMDAKRETVSWLGTVKR